MKKELNIYDDLNFSQNREFYKKSNSLFISFVKFYRPMMAILLLIFCLVLPAWSQVEIIPPKINIINPLELDEVSRQQLEYFKKVALHINKINQMDFFEPYNPKLKRKISNLLNKAADIEMDECHKKYLYSLAFNILRDTFYSMTPEWYNLDKNKIEIIVLPDKKTQLKKYWVKWYSLFYPVDLKSIRLSDSTPSQESSQIKSPERLKKMESHKIFDTFIYVNDEKETEKVEQMIAIFDKLHDHVPLDKKSMVVPFTPIAPAIKIVHLEFSTVPKHFSIVYPSLEVFTHTGRFKIVIFKNLVDAYAKCILNPISNQILEDSSISPVEITGESLLTNFVMYKISHHIGPAFAITIKKTDDDEKEAENRKINPEAKGGETPDRAQKVKDPSQKDSQKQKKSEHELKLLSEAMGPIFSMVEDLKSRTISISNIQVLVEDGLIPKSYTYNLYATYLVTLVDQIRKSSNLQNSQSAVIQFNYLLKKEALRYNINTKKISIQYHIFSTIMQEFANEVIAKFKSMGSLISGYGQMGPELKSILETIKSIPKDVNINLNANIAVQSQSN